MARNDAIEVDEIGPFLFEGNELVIGWFLRPGKNDEIDPEVSEGVVIRV